MGETVSVCRLSLSVSACRLGRVGWGKDRTKSFANNFETHCQSIFTVTSRDSVVQHRRVDSCNADISASRFFAPYCLKLILSQVKPRSQVKILVYNSIPGARPRAPNFPKLLIRYLGVVGLVLWGERFYGNAKR